MAMVLCVSLCQHVLFCWLFQLRTNISCLKIRMHFLIQISFLDVVRQRSLILVVLYFRPFSFVDCFWGMQHTQDFYVDPPHTNREDDEWQKLFEGVKMQVGDHWASDPHTAHTCIRAHSFCEQNHKMLTREHTWPCRKYRLRTDTTPRWLSLPKRWLRRPWTSSTSRRLRTLCTSWRANKQAKCIADVTLSARSTP